MPAGLVLPAIRAGPDLRLPWRLPMTTSVDARAHLSESDRAWLLAKLRFPVLATTRRDGSVSQSVVWFDLDPADPDRLIINTLRGRVRDLHVRRDPRVSLCFEEGNDYLTIEGRAEITDDPVRGDAEILALAHRYGTDESGYAHGERVPIRVHIERVVWHE